LKTPSPFNRPQEKQEYQEYKNYRAILENITTKHFDSYVLILDGLKNTLITLVTAYYFVA
jgi:hypothetical protein